MPNEYRNANHKGKYSKYKLSNDIEKNPGPAIYYVDPSKTIRAPYSQGNVHIFGVNAGQQCVAMSLCALIYHNMRGINSSNDLLKTMHIGNELYSSLSQLARQSFLMLTELPTMLTVLDENYQHTGNIHGDSAIDGFQYCMGLQRALQSLISQQYNSFILIVGAVGVAIPYPDDGQFSIFDSHARDIYGNSHPQGTCDLLHVPCISHLVHYFQSLYGLMDTYELKGVKVTSILPTENNQNANTSSACNLNKSIIYQSMDSNKRMIC